MGKFKAKQFEERNDLVEHYLEKIDKMAEEVRAVYVTAKPGQIMTYEIKYQEALAGGGPMLQQEADSLGMNLQDVVDSVLVARGIWLNTGGQIEGARLKAKQMIRSASTGNEMHSIVENLIFLGNQET